MVEYQLPYQQVHQLVLVITLLHLQLKGEHLKIVSEYLLTTSYLIMAIMYIILFMVLTFQVHQHLHKMLLLW